MGRRLAPSEVAGDIWEYQYNRNNTYANLMDMDLIKKYFEDLKRDKEGDEGTYFTLNNYEHALTILDSRSIWWNNQRHLVPMLDFINCQSGPEAEYNTHGVALDAFR